MGFTLNLKAVDKLAPYYDILQKLKTDQAHHIDNINRLESQLILIDREISYLQSIAGMREYILAKEQEDLERLRRWELTFFGRTF